jgi:hypothetical protein
MLTRTRFQLSRLGPRDLHRAHPACGACDEYAIPLWIEDARACVF